MSLPRQFMHLATAVVVFVAASSTVAFAACGSSGCEANRERRYSSDTAVPPQEPFDVFSSAYFYKGSKSLLPRDKMLIKSMLADWSRYCSDTVLLEAHSDRSGSRSANQKLATARLTSVRSFIHMSGFKTVQIQARYLGPVDATHDADARRVDIVLLNCSKE